MQLALELYGDRERPSFPRHFHLSIEDFSFHSEVAKQALLLRRSASQDSDRENALSSAEIRLP